MSEHKVIDIIDGQPAFERSIDTILSECKKGGAIKILSPLEYHTERQQRWYKGVCLKGLSDWNGETKSEWDLRLKAQCGGNELLKKERIYLASNQFLLRLTIKGVPKRKMTEFIENILSKAITEGWPVSPPDPELRKM